MKKFLGLSLPELLVSIAVVSVVGAGMADFSRSTRLASCRANLSNENQQGLLLT